MALLRTLRIRNLIIIEDLTAEFGPGLNLLTGETGAGKSILVDALGLVAGARADRSLVRSGAGGATVEALFEVGEDPQVRQWAREQGIPEPEEGQLVVRREIAAAGAGRVIVNGSPCTLGQLRELARHLLDLHRQHEQRSLLGAERHLELLDRVGGHTGEAETVERAYRSVQAGRGSLAELERRAAERDDRVERLRRTVQAIDATDPQPGELDRLEHERRVLQNAGRVVDLLDRVVTLTYEGEPAAAALAAAAAAQAEELAEVDPALAPLAGRLRSAALELEDAGAGFRDYREGADFDPARLDILEQRRASLERLCLEHGVDEAGLLERRARASAELEQLEAIESELAGARRALERAEADHVEACAVLTRKRGRAAKRLEAAVAEQLGSLALGQARFGVRLIAGPPGPRGAERAEFMLAANPGEPAAPLRQVASGGELSRVMLALHVVVGDDDPDRRRVLVFDEVDSGVGGPAADAIGARLGRLARSAQVLCVTHQPQVAAHADLHHSVSKKVLRGRTLAGIANLSDTERVEELARMLGGRQPTAASRRHASELLSAAARSRRAEPRSRW